MNRDEAKYILSAYPVTGQAGDDAQFKEALSMAQHDPELRDWFANEQAFDAAMAQKLQSISPPAELARQICAAQKIVQPPAWRFQNVWTGAAAAIVILAFAISWFTFGQRGPRLDDFQTFVVNTTATLDHLDLNTNDLAAIRDRLAQGRSPSDFAAPEGFRANNPVGCRTFDWQGKRISLICFRLGEQRVAHLFVIDRGALRNLPANRPVQVQTGSGGIATAVWSDQGHAYIAALRNGEVELKHALL